MRARIPFLNWRPDAEEVGNDGLVTADNVIHDTEGWKPVHLKTTTGFATTGGLAASAATILSIVCKPVGPAGDVICAWIANEAAPTVHVGVNGITAATLSTGYPIAFTTGTSEPVIQAFDVTELDEYIVFTVLAQGGVPGGGSAGALSTGTVGYTAYMDY